MKNVASYTLDTAILDRIAANLGVNTDRAVNAIAHEVETIAKERAPYKTGALKNSIRVRKMKRGLYRVQDGMEYGIYQELGTSRMSAQPFMVPAVEVVRRRIAKKWGGLFK